ncbi:hypothetical protein G3576_29500 [Roseomonas stagni]|uniref:RepB-like DNA primase domain-containing protein n=1 Tax=Falsiroseomonas algicola TaxID=2716930 RepID=A0A6M1LW38_9PROT|nr:hypothetical protein [Falsiroseomonas algicola]NGM24163.1 hypothetical protein [Falsiroseomonas algicola]
MSNAAATEGAVDAARLYSFTFGDHQTQAAWKDVRSLTWPDLVTLMTSHPVGPKSGSCIVPARFHGAARKKTEAQQIDVALLDSDVGHTLEELRQAVAGKGWRAIITSTHSHLTPRTSSKRGAWDKFLATHGDPETAPAAFLLSKGYLPHITQGAKVVGTTTEEVTFEHQPCPKFRVIIPLARAWLAAAYDSQAQANAAWKERIEALAAALSLNHDQSCTDTSRLFYLPRRPPDGPPPEYLVLDGEHCDIFALPAPPQPPRPGQARRRRLRPDANTKLLKAMGVQVSAEGDGVTFQDPDTGEIVELQAWASRGGGQFQLRSALQARRPGVFLGKVVDGVKHHLTCVNADEHSSTDADTATIVIDASESDSKGFIYFCHHNHCVTRDRLYMLRRMLEQRWLLPEDLENPAYYLSGKAPRPLIRYLAGDLPRIVDQAEQVLVKAAAGIYQRGSYIVRPGVIKVDVDQRGISSLRITEVQEMSLVEELTRHADWEKFDGRSESWVRIDAPNRVAKAYIQRTGRRRLPVLTGLVDAPTLRSDGSILDQVGYDAATGLLYDARGMRFPAIPRQPSKAQAEQALATLAELLSTFPFVDEASRSVAYSVILTACIRRSLPTAPLHAFTAPVAGSGKSTLVDLASIIATGRDASVISQGKSEEELEKRLGALLLAGDLIIAIDNCAHPIDSEFLCSMLTQAKVRPRILGRSEAPELPANGLITATGNNLVLVGDLTRRAIICTLNPKVERPELREFDRNPMTTARENRHTYLAAALTVLRAYHVAGRPDQPPALGSFETWSGWVRGALLWLGLADPVSTMEELREEDPQLEAQITVLSHWASVIGSARTSTRAIIERATQPASTGAVFGMGIRVEYLYPDFREALLAVAGDNGSVNGRRLGKWIKKHEDRIVQGMRIVRCGFLEGTMTWRLEQKE